MWTDGRPALVALLLLAAAAAQQVPPATTRPRDATDAWFGGQKVARLHVDLAADQLKKLKAAPREFVRASLREEGGTTIEGIGVKLKGAGGSYRDWDNKPALTLRIDKFTNGQRFHDLAKLHLNNSVQDDSYLCEALCAELFTRAGVPTPRIHHARVWLNGRDVGLYVVKEGVDKRFLRRWFADATGNLYDGGFCQDVDADLEKDAGEDPADKHDLHALRAACQAQDLTQSFTAIERLVDVDAMLTFMAMELMVAHWDGYTAKANNYRLYFDPARKIACFLPQGMDQVFGELDMSILAAPGGMVAQRIMKKPEWRARFRQRVDELMPLFDVPLLHRRIDALAARLRTELSGRAGASHAERVREIKERVAGRVARLKVQSATPEPRPVSFERSATVSVTGWRPVSESEDARLETTAHAGFKTLAITAGPGGSCKASFRTNVLLAKGRYRFSGVLRTRSVAGEEAGATLRISGAQRERAVTGSTEWQPLQFEFEVGEALRDVQLVAELRGSRGQVWFQLDSLELTRLSP